MRSRPIRLDNEEYLSKLTLIERNILEVETLLEEIVYSLDQHFYSFEVKSSSGKINCILITKLNDTLVRRIAYRVGDTHLTVRRIILDIIQEADTY